MEKFFEMGRKGQKREAQQDRTQIIQAEKQETGNIGGNNLW